MCIAEIPAIQKTAATWKLLSVVIFSWSSQRAADIAKLPVDLKAKRGESFAQPVTMDHVFHRLNYKVS